MRNPLDPSNGIQWNRDIFKSPTAVELNNTVFSVNLMDINQTNLPALTMADLNCLALGKTKTLSHFFKN